MRAALIAVLATASFAAQAQLYKWVDEKGRTHYSEKPPATGQKSQTIRADPAPPAAAAPTPAAKGAGKGAPKAAAVRGTADADRLEGTWASGPGTVEVRLGFTSRRHPEVFLGQQWSIGNRSQVNTPAVFTVDGNGGAGVLLARDPASHHVPDVPTRIGYRLEGNTLRISVSSGLYAGEHVLTRN